MRRTLPKGKTLCPLAKCPYNKDDYCIDPTTNRENDDAHCKTRSGEKMYNLLNRKWRKRCTAVRI